MTVSLELLLDPPQYSVSEYTVTELPRMLASKLRVALQDCKDDEEKEMDITASIMAETFIELDQKAPADPSGGCTATVVLQQGRKIYIANAGDSRSFIVTYRPSTGQTEIVYMSREDKPSLPDEKDRVEAAGGQVYIPMRGTSRVVYNDPVSGAPTGLAMSRSIGDWAAGKMGVIPDPIVHVLDIDTLVSTELYGIDEKNPTESYNVDAQGQATATEDDVYIFAVSATDGMMDYLHEDEIAKILASSLFEDAGAHPISACEHLVFAAAQAWQQAKQGRYRDDIAIAVSILRRPPEAQQKTPPAQ
jgi:serine/threonine protein phosphatase PrpC